MFIRVVVKVVFNTVVVNVLVVDVVDVVANVVVKGG